MDRGWAEDRVEKNFDDEVAKISGRVRRWREEKGITQQELATRSGLAISTIHKVETGQMIPSISVLLKVAHGLGRRPTEVVADVEYEDTVAVMRTVDREPIGVEGKIVVERLSGEILDPILEMWRVTLHPGMSSGSKPIKEDGEALIVCEKGKLAVRIGEDEHILAAGDVIHYKVDIPHSWCNKGRSVAQFTITGALPTKMLTFLHRTVTQVVA
jgi:transcriptional regulator with XRE-family HTH domain